MTDENMVDLVNGQLILHQLHLGTFATIYQEVAVLNSEILRSGEAAKSW